jgi:phosphoribosylformylglycinamidine cyclo-ligase
MSATGLTYAAAGVDYQRMDALKLTAQKAARQTGANASRNGMVEVESSRGESAYVMNVGGQLIASITECLGTKALVADGMRLHSGRSHYDTIAQDTVAAALNDLVSVGATPVSIHAYWSTGNSEWFSDEERTRDLVMGWTTPRSCTINLKTDFGDHSHVKHCCRRKLPMRRGDIRGESADFEIRLLPLLSLPQSDGRRSRDEYLC